MKRTTILRTVFAAALALVITMDRSRAAGNGASHNWETGYIAFDVPNYEGPCQDEPFYLYGSVPYKVHEVWTPAGGYHYKFQWIPMNQGGGFFTLIGEETGTVWHAQGGSFGNEVIHLGPGEIYTYRGHERYKSDDGDTLTIDWHIRLTTNANGDLVVDRFESTCR